jgi:hypothetical protein
MYYILLSCGGNSGYECSCYFQYYAKNGTCKFGSNCKFDHPREGGFVPVTLNSGGFPLRLVGVLIAIHVSV